MSKRMTIAEYYRWFHREWMRAGLVVAVFLLVYLTVLVAPVNLVLYAMLLCAPLYMLHETEEYIFPGGFAQFANQGIYRQDPENGLADETAIFWINMGYIWLALPVSGLLAVYDLRFAAWMPYFFIFQALVHVMLSIVARRTYSPGLITALFLHVPFAVWAILLLQAAGVVQSVWWNVHLMVGFMAILGFPLMGLILLQRYRKRMTRPGTAM